MASPVEGAVLGKYRWSQELAHSAFSTVWLAEHTELYRPVVIKMIAKSKIAANAQETRFIREVNLLKQMDHPFLIKIFDVLDDDVFQYLVMEFADRNDITTFVPKGEGLSEEAARRNFVQLVSALEYLHDVSCVPHRDLQAQHILLDKNNNLRLIGFGLSHSTLDPAQLCQAHAHPYAAPEVLQGKKYTTLSDIWSAGVVLFLLATGFLPFEDEDADQLCQQITTTAPVFPPTLSPQLADLLQKILQRRPEERITIPRIKEHPWFSVSVYFSLRSLWHTTPQEVDPEVVGRIASLGYDPKMLMASMLCDDESAIAVLYKIIGREHLTGRIDVEMRRAIDAPVTRARRTTDELALGLSAHAGSRALLLKRALGRQKNPPVAGFPTKINPAKRAAKTGQPGQLLPVARAQVMPAGAALAPVRPGPLVRPVGIRASTSGPVSTE
jgi:5'-AMP-activated protein kinase catalytic alpha subunit